MKLPFERSVITSYSIHYTKLYDEVVDFIENDLGPEGLKRSVVVVATSDQTPLARIRNSYNFV